MYKIIPITTKILDEYYLKYAHQAKKLMLDLRDGKTSITSKLGRSAQINIKYIVNKDSPTWRFLNKYSDDKELKKLLCGSWDETMNIIKYVEKLIPDLEWQKRATKRNYLDGKYSTFGKDKDGYVLIDHFNEILRWIFITNLYDEELDKLEFIENLGLKICPYCGRQHINVAKYSNHQVSKPNIDHFLPKSLYPFFAISFINLIPCCAVCNEMANKGNYDPINPNYGLHNPHLFDDENIKFRLEFDNFNELDESSYLIRLNCNPTTLDVGYKEILKLLAFYEQEKLKAQDLYINFTKSTESHKLFLKELNIKDEFLRDYARMIIGHPLDDRPSQREYYKFRKDIFMQLAQEYKVDV